MAEPFGIVAGALGIAGLFTAAVDTFDYIQLGRHFGEDYQKAQLKLDIAAMRLSRWGRAVNIANDPNLSLTMATIPEAEKAKEVLVSILDLFEKAQKDSGKYKLEKKEDQMALQVWGENDMGVSLRSLHGKMKDVVKRRQKGASLGQKVSWALYRNKEFKRLVEDVTEFVGALEGVFPVATVTKQLSALDIAEVIDEKDVSAEPSLKALEAAAEDIDEVLKETIKDVVATTTTYKNITMGDSTKLVLGTYVADSAVGKKHEKQGGNVSYEGIHAKGKATVVIGDHIGGKGVFDD